MAKNSFDEELPKKISEIQEQEAAEILEDLKQKQKAKRLNRAKRIAQAGEIAARLSGHEDLAEDLSRFSELAGSGRENEEGAIRQAGSNVGGRLAGKMAGEGVKVPFGKKIAGAGLSGGKAAAIGGAVSGALQGEGVGGIVKTGFAWWWLNIVFGTLIIEEITLVGILLATLSLAYLDFHYIMSKIKKGKGFFINMGLWQKIVLAISNLLVLTILLMGVVVMYTTACDGIVNRTIVTVFVNKNFCSAFNQITKGGGSGGAGASGGYTTGLLVPIPQQYVKMAAFGSTKFDYPKLVPEFESIVETIMAQAQAAGLNVSVTSALRQPGGPEGYSCHYLGEAVDIDFAPPIPIRPTDPKQLTLIDNLLAIVKSAGPGFVQDEYRKPSAGATAGHVHLAYTSDPNCVGRQGEVAQYSGEYTMPY